MNDLETRYARLIRLYPAAYRRERGDEMLATLAESDGNPRRETIALVVGALRAHAGGERRRNWFAAFHMGALMLLITAVAFPAQQMLVDAINDYPPLFPYDLAYATGAGALAIVAVFRRWYHAAILLGAVAFGLAQAVHIEGDVPAMWQVPLATLLLVPLLRHGPGRISGVLRWAPLLPLVLLTANWGLTEAFPEVSGLLRSGLYLALFVAALVWLAIDERVAMALGFLTLDTVVSLAAYGLGGGGFFVPTFLITAAFPATLLGAAALRARFTARV